MVEELRPLYGRPSSLAFKADGANGKDRPLTAEVAGLAKLEVRTGKPPTAMAAVRLVVPTLCCEVLLLDRIIHVCIILLNDYQRDNELVFHGSTCNQVKGWVPRKAFENVAVNIFLFYND